ncbi:MAG TPA: hypothetical protein DEP28_10115 [Bacteroidetes bacterium]|nr:hypothetical protein [Bacteroidota bacterium]HCN36801.1 hypothetical protein [Bacteroidota bacterium]
MKKIFFIIFILFSQGVKAQENITFYFDASGSMTGYYNDPSSTFRLFAKALMKNSMKDANNISVNLFSKSETKRGIESPINLFSGNVKNFSPDKAVNEFKIPIGKDNDYGKTDLIQALDDGINSLDNERGIIWLLTDNINDNFGSGDSTYKNTLEFYERLRNDNNLRKILLFPFSEIIQEKDGISRGFVAYGIVYSPEALSQSEYEHYDKIFRSLGIKQKPITLKPLDIGTIVLIPQKTQSKITEGKLYYDGKTLRGFGFDEGQAYQEVFNNLTLKSNLFPYRIKSANLKVQLDDFTSSDYSVKSLGTQTITPSTVSNVSPEGEVTGFAVTFNLPDITPTFSLNTIFKDEFTIGGNLILEVSNTDVSLDEEYVNQFKELFALQSVPEIFKPVLKDKKIITQIPLEIKMKYGPWRLFVLISLIVVILLIVILLIYLLLKKLSFELKINNDETSLVTISSLNSYSMSHNYSMELGKFKKSISGRLKFTYSKFTDTPNKTVDISEGIPYDITYTNADMNQEKIVFSINFANKNKKSSEEKLYSQDTFTDIH